MGKKKSDKQKLKDKIKELEGDIDDLLNNPHCEFERCRNCNRYHSVMMVCRHCGTDNSMEEEEEIA